MLTKFSLLYSSNKWYRKKHKGALDSKIAFNPSFLISLIQISCGAYSPKKRSNFLDERVVLILYSVCTSKLGNTCVEPNKLEMEDDRVRRLLLQPPELALPLLAAVDENRFLKSSLDAVLAFNVGVSDRIASSS